MLKAIELEIELFCRGMRIDPSCHVQEDARRIARTRAGLGSGLEVVLPRRPKDIWVNVPVVEKFAESSPFSLTLKNGHYTIADSRDGQQYSVRIPPEPSWYSRKTTAGTEMSRVGVLQGNYLGIYVSNSCLYWSLKEPVACKFCTTGKNVGANEEPRKKLEDVIEVAIAARDESGSVFTHLNTGYHFEDVDARKAIHGPRQCLPYVKAIREKVGGFIGVQAVPLPRESFDLYDEVIAAGVDHFSFCYEFEDPQYFAEYCPGKAQTVGQKAFFDAMEYTSKKMGKGRVAGEIIAGVEPIAATKRGIDRIVNAGAFPTVCVFRPTIGSEMENAPPPDPDEMKEVFAYMYQACVRAGIPIGILPIEVSLVVNPEEASDLIEPTISSTVFGLRNSMLRQLAKPYVAWKMRPRPSRSYATA